MDITSYLLGKKSSSGGGGGTTRDWTVLGFSSEPKTIQDGYDYAQTIKDNNTTTKLQNDTKLIYMPSMEYSGTSDMSNWLANCPCLESVATLTFGTGVSSINSLFYGDTALKQIERLVLDSSLTEARQMCSGCSSLETAPNFDTSHLTRMDSMFYQCSKLKDVPQYDTSNVTRLSSMFSQCPSLTDESLNNILKMCINMNLSYSRAKTLAEIGFTSSNYSASRIQGLSEYANFTNAGWTIGY